MREPVNAVGYFTGGGRYGYLSIRFAQALEEQSGRRLCELFTGGFIGSSVGTITASTAAFDIMPMKNVAKHFAKELPLFMPHNPWFYRKQGLVDIKNMIVEGIIETTQLKRLSEKFLEFGVNTHAGHTQYALLKAERAARAYISKERAASLYDREYMEGVINRWFGSVTMSDSNTPLFLTSQKSGPCCREPYDFYFVDPEEVKAGSPLDTPNETRNVSVADAILAATAMPTAFGAHYIPQTGNSHTDQAQVDTGALQIAKLEHSLKNGLGMGLVQFDTFLENTPITAIQHNAKGWLRSIADQSITNNQAIQTKLSARQEYEIRLGKNYHLLEFSRGNIKHAPFNTDILDTSPEEIQNMMDGMEEYLHRNMERKIMPVVDFLVENLEAHEARRRGWIGTLANSLSLVRSEKPIQDQPEIEETMPPETDQTAVLQLVQFENKHP